MLLIQDLLKKMVELGASDLHLIAGAPPLIRLSGSLKAADPHSLEPEECQHLSYGVLTEEQRVQFEREGGLDFSFGMPNLGRFRANLYRQRGSVSLALRFIPFDIKNLEELGLPEVVSSFAKISTGLVLVTGATGSGKSTTLAALVDKINTTQNGHILTIEDPVEFVHKHKKCMISQREINSDAADFASALRMALRQDPDFVLLGEMRDPETIETALTIAETGHLTLATLHTNSAVQTINRIVDSFSADKQTQIRTLLSFVLQAVVSQVLVPKKSGGRVVACEVLVATHAVRTLIRENKIHQLQSAIETGGKYGMQTLNASLGKMIQSSLIDPAEAFTFSSDPEGLKRFV